MARKSGGFDWKTYRVTSDVVDNAVNPSKYSESERIETGGFRNDMKIVGQFSLEPLFLNNYMLSHSI